jgi:DNA-3-methyladenine glycosylase II
VKPGAPEVRIEPRGEFSWSASLDMVASWQPVTHFPRSDGGLTLAFCLDGTFTPAATSAWWEDGALCGRVSAGADAPAVTTQLARMFSLDIDASEYPAVGRRDPAIGRVMRAHAGLRPVLFPSPYEAAVWAVISQRIAQPQASRAKVALSEASGDALAVDGVAVRCLPSPTQLLRVRDARGLTAEKIERLHAVARAALDGVLDAERLKALGYDNALRALQAIRGIGPFWSSGIYLRACGVTEPFPSDEPRSVRALADAHGLGEMPSGAELERMVEHLRPFGMWVSVLLRVAANRGSMGPQVD